MIGAANHFCYIQGMSISAAILYLGMVPIFSLAQGAVPQSTYVMCRAQKTVRTIRVATNAGLCETIYTKQGVDKVVSSGRNRNSCVNVFNNIRTNLEGAGWKCKDISSAAVTDSKD
jgi:hypothetical protein